MEIMDCHCEECFQRRTKMSARDLDIKRLIEIVRSPAPVLRDLADLMARANAPYRLTERGC